MSYIGLIHEGKNNEQHLLNTQNKEQRAPMAEYRRQKTMSSNIGDIHKKKERAILVKYTKEKTKITIG